MAAPKGNQFGKGNSNAGRKPKLESPAFVNKCLDEYFEKCKQEERPLTITGMARSLGLSRKQLIEYEERQGFRNVIKDGRSRVEQQFEELLVTGKNAASTIFWLKNSGWSDKQEIEVNDISEQSRKELEQRYLQLAKKVSKAA